MDERNISEIEGEIRRLSQLSGDPYNGEYYGENGAVTLAPQIESLKSSLGQDGEATIGAASTYFSAFGHAIAKMLSSKWLPFLFMLWAWRAFNAYWQAINRAFLFLELVEEAEYQPTPSDCDVCGSIFATMPFKHTRKKALRIFSMGLAESKKSCLDGEKGSGLLLVKIGHIYGKLGDVTQGRNYIERALNTLGHCTDSKISNRIYRAAGDFYCTNDSGILFQDGWMLLEVAEDIAKKAELADSVLKVQAVKQKHRKKAAKNFSPM